MTRIFAVVLALLLLPLDASAKRPPPKQVIVEVPGYTLAAPPADMAQIVLVEPINKIQGLFPVGIFEIEGDTRKLVAATGYKSKSVLLLTPGKHLLMATQGGPGHFLEANVEAGKRYYVLLRFIYAQGLQLRPIRATTTDYNRASKDFADWMKSTRWIEKAPDAEAWAEDAKANFDTVQANGVANWNAKTPEERAELTLTPADAAE